MNCFECAMRGEAVPAVATCGYCGAGMCLEHLADAQTNHGGGTAFTCTHDLHRAVAARRAAATASVTPVGAVR
jgi:hypothetical protein